MAYLLDTSVAIHLRDGDPAICAKIAALDENFMLSIVTRVELEGGAHRAPDPGGARRMRLQAMLRDVAVLPFEDSDADAYRTILESAGYSRRKLLDRMIAAQALTHGLTLITTNPADFADIPGLVSLAW